MWHPIKEKCEFCGEDLEARYVMASKSVQYRHCNGDFTCTVTYVAMPSNSSSAEKQLKTAMLWQAVEDAGVRNSGTADQ